MVLHKQSHNTLLLYALQKRKKTPLIFNILICPDVRENKQNKQKISSHITSKIIIIIIIIHKNNLTDRQHLLALGGLPRKKHS